MKGALIVILVLAGSGGMSSPAVASSQDVLIALGGLRQQHGLPSVTEDANLSAGCRALMAHRQANGGTVGHRSSWPEAARVLSWWTDPTGWGNGGSRPTAQYPNADAGLLDPTTTRVGVSDGCLGFTWQRRTVSALRISVETGARETSAGQRWIGLRGVHEVRIPRR